uniref:protein FAM13A-like isoform X2 n=1 Tax=Myxine glutinosa TaxID=7769 RepID=UPI00358FE561
MVHRSRASTHVWPVVKMGAGAALRLCRAKGSCRAHEDARTSAPVPQPPVTTNEQTSLVPAACCFGIPLGEQLMSGKPVPALLQTLADYLERNGLSEAGLFRVSGSARMVEELRHRLENGEEVDWDGLGDIASAASIFKLFLRELPDAVVPGRFNLQLVQSYRECKADSAQLSCALATSLGELPSPNYSLLRFLCYFLTRVASQSSTNKMPAANLATVFGPCIFRVSTGLEGVKQQEVLNHILACMITDCSTLFDRDVDSLHSCPDKALAKSALEPRTNKHASDVCKGETSLGRQEEETSSHDIECDASTSSILPASPEPLVEQSLFETSRSGDHGGTIDGVGLTARQRRRLQKDEKNKENTAPKVPEKETRSMEPPKKPKNGCGLGDTTDLSPRRDGDGLKRPHSGPCTRSDVLPSGDRTDSDTNPDGICTRVGDATDGPTIREGLGQLAMPSASFEVDTLPVEGSTPTKQVHVPYVNESPGWSTARARRHDLPKLTLTAFSTDEPVRTFQDWHAEGGEAHPSPRPVRLMRRLPLEGDQGAIPSPRSPSLSPGQRDHTDPEAPPSPPNAPLFIRVRSSSLGTHEGVQEEPSVSQLSKRIQSLKKKMRKFEEQFEEVKNYRPSHSDKAADPDVLKWMNELSRVRKQLRDIRLRQQGTDMGFLGEEPKRRHTLPRSFGSSASESEASADLDEPGNSGPSVEQTVDGLWRRLGELRKEAGRPNNPEEMTRDQLLGEKLVLQKSLLHYESEHGRPITRQDKHFVKPMYDRYRLVKHILARARDIPIIEEEGSEEEGQGSMGFRASAAPRPLVFRPRLQACQYEEHEQDGFVSPVEEGRTNNRAMDNKLANLHAASRTELQEQLKVVKAEKRQLRRRLRDFEDKFYLQYGRNVQREDREPWAEQYAQYKDVKAKLRLVAALVTKNEARSTT